MRRRNTMLFALLCIIAISFLCYSGLFNFCEFESFEDTDEKMAPYIMVNQIGYFKDGIKLAIIRTNLDL